MENDGANAAGQAQPQAQPQAVDANAALVRTLNPTMKRSININVLTSAAFESTALSQSSFSRSTRSRAVEPDGGVVGSGVALQAGIMAFRSCAMRFISRSFSGGGKVLGEEEKSVENVYIKGLRPEETAGAGSTRKISTDTYRNYAVLAGVITIAARVGWYLKSGEEVQE